MRTISMGALAAYYTLGCDQLAPDAVARFANLPIVPLPHGGKSFHERPTKVVNYQKIDHLRRPQKPV
jgi:hypothetical protein